VKLRESFWKLLTLNPTVGAMSLVSPWMEEGAVVMAGERRAEGRGRGREEIDEGTVPCLVSGNLLELTFHCYRDPLSICPPRVLIKE
jgi:hypothetical protein